MKIDDLRGKEFTHCSEEFPIYVVGKSVDGICDIHWKNKSHSSFTTVYRDEQVVDYFKRGIWIKIK
jgi:hypothetical protein